MSETIELSGRGLQNAASINCKENFAFSIGGKKEYKCNRLFAAFISPFVARVLKTDPIFNRVEIPIDDPNNYFDLVMDLMIGKPVHIDSASAEFLISVGRFLDNAELMSLASKYAIHTLSVKNVVDRLISKSQCQTAVTEEIDFISSHLYELPFGEFERLDLATMKLILESPNLTVESESWLFSLVISVIDKFGDEAIPLLESVRAECLSPSEMSVFLSKCSPSGIPTVMWSAICSRLKLPVQPEVTQASKRRYIAKNLPYDPSFPFNGVFQWMSSFTKGSAHDQGVVKVTASSTEFDDPSVVISESEDACWYSENKQNSWIMVDFKRHALRMSYYTLQTHQGSSGNYHMKSWVVEGSVDGENWAELDRRENINDLNGTNLFHTYECQKSMNSKYIRIRQNGENQSGDYSMLLKRIEFFGDLLPESEAGQD